MVKGLKGSGATGAQLESLNLNSCIYIRVGLFVRDVGVSVGFRVFAGGKKSDLFPICLFRIWQCFLSLSFSGILCASWT